MTVFQGARLILGDGNPPIENAAFVVEGDRFARIGRSGELQAPVDAVRVDLTGKTVMPALIDAHSHIGYMQGLTSGPQNYTREHILDHMYRFAYHGVAASQAMGSDFGVMPFQLRDEILAGKYPDAARFLTAGRGLAPPAEILSTNMRHAAYAITTEEGARANVRELAYWKVSLIKTWVDDREGTIEKLAPTPVPVRSAFTVKVGVKCSEGCRLAGRVVRVSDEAGSCVAEGRLGETPGRERAGCTWQS